MNYFIEKYDSKNNERLLQILKCFKLTSIELSHFIVYPEIIWGKKYIDTKNIINLFIKKYQNINKKIIFFLNCDFREPLYFENTIIFRTSIEYSKIQINEKILPIIWPEKLGKFTHFLPKDKLPIVGFCGCLNTNIMRKIMALLIIKNDNIKHNFILRKQFLAKEIPDKEKTKQDFYENINNSHFTLCINGLGNFSIRFYQTLSCGRIPVFLETDTILPFSNKIDWDNIIIKDKNPKNLVKKIIKCYQNEDIIEKQKKCLKIFQEYFTIDAYSKKFKNLIKI